jgi:hypothetical protein
MNACKLSAIGLSSILVLAAAGCSVHLGEAPGAGEPTTPAVETEPDPVPVDVNGDVTEVSVVGTGVSSDLHLDGTMAITVLPRNAAHEVIMGSNLVVDVKITLPSGVTVETTNTDCRTPAANVKSTAIGVILDDSRSMIENDPQMQRKSAAVSFLKALGAEDTAMLADYGNTGDSLRDLVCMKNGGAGCSPLKPSFTRDKLELIAAAAQIAEGPDGTPLYESCVEMVSIVGTMRDQRQGMLLLSDGQPTSTFQREACHKAARDAAIPVFTVGLGPAAEAAPTADAAAVKVLRDLAYETGGSYASANDPAQLEQLFQNIGTALAHGSCRSRLKVKTTAGIEPGTKVTGEVTVGSKGAKASFTFIAPSR